jgi:hypothetical protein
MKMPWHKVIQLLLLELKKEIERYLSDEEMELEEKILNKTFL